MWEKVPKLSPKYKRVLEDAKGLRAIEIEIAPARKWWPHDDVG